MAMRMSGMISGMDTESIVQQLVEARSVKVKTKTKEQTKLSWKQDAWKSLNTKLKALMTQYAGNMRFSSSYVKKTTNVSNSSKVSVSTGDNAVNSVQELKVNKLAKSGYLTGGQLSTDGSYTALSKLSDIEGFSGGSGTFTVTTGGKSIDIAVNDNTTISGVLTKLKDAGLNASFDEKNQRFFVSAKTTGKAADFSLTASDGVGASALSALGLQTDVSKDDATKAQYTAYASKFVSGDAAQTKANLSAYVDTELAKRVDSKFSTYKSLQEKIEKAQKNIDAITDKYAEAGTTLKGVDEYDTLISAQEASIEEKEAAIAAAKENGEDITALEEELKAAKDELGTLKSEQADAKTLEAQQTTIDESNDKLTDLAKDITVTTDADGKATAEATVALKAQVENDEYAKAEYADKVISGAVTVKAGATKVNGQDAEIELNGVSFTGNTNVFQINGLTITALGVTAEDETITLTTQDDTDGIYKMIKDFFTKYNEIVNEMDKLYNAPSAKGYEPLTDEEKESMTEKQIEDWETKIKDAILRRDDTLSNVNSKIQLVMSTGIKVGDRTMYLSDFGINTLSYFSSNDNEKHAFHIDGDADDEYTSTNADKLKSMIAADPDTVVSFFSKLSQNLYTTMSGLSSSVDGYRSYGSFYNDKQAKSQYDEYTTKIREMQQKVDDYEDRWYKKFSKMETALAKLQKKTAALGNLLGTGQ